MLKPKDKPSSVSGIDFFMIPDFLKDKMVMDTYVHKNRLYVELMNKIAPFKISEGTVIHIIVEGKSYKASFKKYYYDLNEQMLLSTEELNDDIVGQHTIKIVFGETNKTELEFEGNIGEFD